MSRLIFGARRTAVWDGERRQLDGLGQPPVGVVQVGGRLEGRYRLSLRHG